MDLNAVRTFVAVAEAGQFQGAADELALSQQAVSKRVATLEKALGVRLLTRGARGTGLTIDGQAFLPHARELLRSAERAADSVRPGRRALRVDVIGRRVSLAGLVRDFHRARPGTDLDIVTLFDSGTAIEAVRSGTIDATFRAVTMPGRTLPEELVASPVLDEPLQLFTGPDHELAGARVVTPAQLAGRRIWMPGNAPGTEWAAYYEELAATFGFTIDLVGPNFGVESLLDTISGSSTLATLLSEQTPLVWPAQHGLRLIPLRDPTPVYPHCLVRRRDNTHPALAALLAYLQERRPALRDEVVWTPEWARPRPG